MGNKRERRVSSIAPQTLDTILVESKMHSVIGQGLTASFSIDHHRSSFFWQCVRSLRCLYHIHDYGDSRDVKLWSKIIEMVMGIHELTDC